MIPIASWNFSMAEAVKQVEGNFGHFPKTRYQGSKRKIASWIMTSLNCLNYESVFDAFGGTATMSYFFKAAGKNVHFNDILRFNRIGAEALVLNHSKLLSDSVVSDVVKCTPRVGFITENFSNTYYTDEENMWLDGARSAIESIECPWERAMAYWCLFQCCIIKRPYNLFHRANLATRTSDVSRSFGNKKTWDTPFEIHFRRFATEINQAVFHSEKTFLATSHDVLEVDGQFDLLYLDPPYINGSGRCDSYTAHYHFLEGLVRYEEWGDLIDRSVRHKPFRKSANTWEDKELVFQSFEALIKKHGNASVAISYRSDGFPPIHRLKSLLEDEGMDVSVFSEPYKYALSKTRDIEEVLVVGRRSHMHAG